MDSKFFLLGALTSLLALLVSTGSGYSLSNRRSSSLLGSSPDANRVNGRRRSASLLSSMPGGRAQQVPNDAVNWAAIREACHGKDIVQNVTETGCETKSIQNRMCYGVCMTIHMPGVPGTEQLELCAQCRPKGPKRLVQITLDCLGGTKRTITVPVVDKCGCSSCNATGVKSV